MIYGLVSDIYLSVITLVVTLILEKAHPLDLGARIRDRHRAPERPERHPERALAAAALGPLDRAVPWTASSISQCGLLLCWSMSACGCCSSPTSAGSWSASARTRAGSSLLGYDSRRYKLAAFVLAAGIAALSGVLYAVWGNFVAPEMFNLNQAAQVVIWVIVGGRSTLIGPIVGTALVQHLTPRLGTSASAR